MKTHKYPSINGLRAISVILVVISHIILHYDILKTLPPKIGFYIYTYCSLNGQLGVNVFFVLSGFLITALLLKEEEHTGTISLKLFYIRRSLRILPAYFFLLFIYFILQSFHYIYIPPKSWITVLTYTKYFNIGIDWRTDWYTGHTWSLSVEEHFYIIWPFIFLAGDTIRKSISLCMIILVPFFKLYLHFYPIAWLNEYNLFTRIDAIAIGCLFALYAPFILKKITHYLTLLFYTSLITLLLLPYFPIWATHKLHTGLFFDYFWVAFGSTHGTLANICIALLMMHSIFVTRGIWFKFLNFKIMHYIGVLSYSLYLWQQLFLFNTDYWANKFPQNLIFIFGAALFSYHVIEKPFLKLKTRFQK